MTDQPKWTPGPWAVERNKRTWGWVDVVGPSLGVGGPTQATDLTLADEVKRIAEAHLIAAAPDMAGVSPRAAEMLRVAATFLRSEEPNGTVFYDGAACDAFCIADDCEAAADDIDAALAKARGQA